MTRCRYDSTLGDYVATNGEVCEHDEYGDPTKHCTARRSCAQHIGASELTCARCVGRTRAMLRRIVDLAALMPVAAIGGGVNSEAAMLAGPACDVEAWTWRKVAARQGRAWHVSLIEDDDEHHPYTVLTRWQMMISEDRGNPLPDMLTTSGAADYLGRQLHSIAQDPEQDFALLSRELKRCRNHLEAALSNSAAPERGIPCPACAEEGKRAPRLIREYGHWCEDEDCRQPVHHRDDAGDWWGCPDEWDHWWTHEAYEQRLSERKMGA